MTVLNNQNDRSLRSLSHLDDVTHTISLKFDFSCFQLTEPLSTYFRRCYQNNHLLSTTTSITNILRNILSNIYQYFFLRSNACRVCRNNACRSNATRQKITHLVSRLPILNLTFQFGRMAKRTNLRFVTHSLLVRWAHTTNNFILIHRNITSSDQQLTNRWNSSLCHTRWH